MSHLRRQLLTGDARRVHWPTFMSTVCLIMCPSHDVVATHCGGGDTYSVELTHVDSQSQLQPLQPLLSPFIPVPVCWQHLLMPATDRHRGDTLCGSLIWIPGDTRLLHPKQ